MALMPGRLERLDRALDRVGRAADDRLAVAVDVGDDDVAVDGADDPLDLGQRAEHRGHRAVVPHRQVRHLAAAGADGLERGVEGQRTGRDERAVLAEAVAHHHVGVHAVGGEQPGQREVGREHGRLGDLGLQQLLLQRRDGFGVVAVDEDVGGQRAPEQRGHDPVGLGEGLGDDRLRARSALEHVDVLRALAGVEEGDLGRRAAADEDALWRSIFHMAGAPERKALDGLASLRREVGGVGVVDGDPHRGAARAGSGAASGGVQPVAASATTCSSWATTAASSAPPTTRAPRSGGRDDPADVAAPADAGTVTLDLVTCADANVRGAVAHGGGPGTCSSRTTWKLVPPKPKALTPARRTPPGGSGQSRSSVLTRNGDGVPVDVGVGVAEVQAGREHLLVQRHDDLEQAGGAGGGLEVADVGLDRAERDRAGRGTGRRRPRSGAELGGVADAGRGAVRLDRGRRSPGRRRRCPGPLDGEPLPDRVGCGDALALAVAGAAEAEEHRVDPVTVALGVGEPLEHEQRRTFAHDEAVGAGVEGPGAGGREGTDLAELDEARRRPCCGRRRR